MFTVRPPTGARCAFAVLLMMALTTRAESYLSFTGTVTPNTNPNFEISFSVNTPDTLNARTWAYSGGTNASGEVIAPGGIDSVLHLYTGGNNFVATNDDINAPANLRDSAITVPSATGGYQLFMSAFVGPGVNIGRGAVIGARAVVTKNMPAWMVCAGNPCKPLKQREVKTLEEIHEGTDLNPCPDQERSRELASLP